MQTQVPVFETTLQKSHEWLTELVQIGRFDDEAQAYSAFRAVLHSLRDRLVVDEAVHLGAQLPMLIRGFYYEGWKPSLAPNRERTREQFLDSVRESLRQNNTIDPEHACRSVFELLNRKVSEGEIADVRSEMSKSLQDLWSGVS